MASIETTHDETAFDAPRELSPTEEQIVRIEALLGRDAERLREIDEERDFLELRTGLYSLLMQGAEQPGGVGLYKLDADRRGVMMLVGGKTHVELQKSPNVTGAGELAEMRVPIVGRFTYVDVPFGYEANSYSSSSFFHEAHETTDVVDFGVIEELQWYGDAVADGQTPNIDSHHLSFRYGDTPYLLSGIPLPLRKIREFIIASNEDGTHERD